MNTTQLIADAKARFKHQENKIYLKEKYTAKLQFASQGGMWTANQGLISFLTTLANNNTTAVIQDNFENPILIEIKSLLHEALTRYDETMKEWYIEHKELIKNR